MALDFGKTANFALRWLKGDNAISDIDEGFRALAEDVDQKTVGYSEGQIGARPAAGVPNRIFKEKNIAGVPVGLWWDSGSAWYSLLPKANGVLVPALSMVSFVSAPVCGPGGGNFGPYTVGSNLFSTACVGAMAEGLIYTDAAHTTPAGQPNFRHEVLASGTGVVGYFQNLSGVYLYPYFQITAWGY